MTTLTHPSEEIETQETAPLERRNRVLTFTVLALAVALLALGAWIIYDANTGSDTAAVPAEIEQLLDDYVSALGAGVGEGFDRDAFLELVTDDWVGTEYFYRQFGDQLAVTEPGIAQLYEYAVNSRWEIDHWREAVVTGEGPWFVSVDQGWEIPSDGERYAGTATYVIVDDAGTLKVAGYYWIGISGIPTS